MIAVQTSLQLGSVLLRGLGVMSNDVSFLRQMMRESMELRAQETLDKKVAKDSDWLVAFQVNQEGLILHCCFPVHLQSFFFIFSTSFVFLWLIDVRSSSKGVLSVELLDWKLFPLLSQFRPRWGELGSLEVWRMIWLPVKMPVWVSNPSGLKIQHCPMESLPLQKTGCSHESHISLL